MRRLSWARLFALPAYCVSLDTVHKCTYTLRINYEWDPNKAQSNREKHTIRFSDAIVVLEDPFAITIPDDCADEERFITVGEDAFGEIVVVVYIYRGETTIRIISARPATKREQRMYREGTNDDD